MPRPLMVLSGLLLLASCKPCPECEKCQECPTTGTSADWDQLRAALESGGSASAPTQVTDNGNQLHDGEIAIILAGPTPVGIGEVFTVKPALATDPWVETWISHERQTQVQPPFPLQLRYVKHNTLDESRLTQGRLDTLNALDAADTTRTYTWERAVFGYFNFPSDPNINALPESLPPGVTTATYEVFTIKGNSTTGVFDAPVRSGGLYREIEIVGGTERWRDTWVLYDNYLAPYCVTVSCDANNNLTAIAELRLVVGAGAAPHLKGFLLDAKADKPGPTTGWKYVPIAPYDLISPLPTTLP